MAEKNNSKGVVCCFFLILISLITYIVVTNYPEDKSEAKTKTKSTTFKKASFWKRYDPNLKSRIDSSNCYGLQKEFNNAADNSDRQRARTGYGNLDLMEYIENVRQKKGC